MLFWPMASKELSFLYRIPVDFRIESLSRKQNMRRKPAHSRPESASAILLCMRFAVRTEEHNYEIRFREFSREYGRHSPRQ